MGVLLDEFPKNRGEKLGVQSEIGCVIQGT